MNVTTNTRPLGYTSESDESNPQLNPDLLLCLPVFSLIAVRSDTLFFLLCVSGKKFYVTFSSLPFTLYTQSVSSSFKAAKLPLLLSSVLKIEAFRPFETLACTYHI